MLRLPPNVAAICRRATALEAVTPMLVACRGGRTASSDPRWRALFAEARAAIAADYFHTDNDTTPLVA